MNQSRTDRCADLQNMNGQVCKSSEIILMTIHNSNRGNNFNLDSYNKVNSVIHP